MSNQSSRLPIDILRFLRHAVTGFLWPRLSIVDSEPGFLALDANGYIVEASQREMAVTSNGHKVAAFKDIQAIHIQHFVNGSGNRRREWWTLSLKTLGRRPFVLGKSRDPTEASIAAAHLSTVVGKPVVALAQTGARASQFEA
jgi:hypothetical protein